MSVRSTSFHSAGGVPVPMRTCAAALLQVFRLLSIAGATVTLAPAYALAQTAVGDSGPACQKGNGTVCQIMQAMAGTTRHAMSTFQAMRQRLMGTSKRSRSVCTRALPSPSLKTTGT